MTVPAVAPGGAEWLASVPSSRYLLRIRDLVYQVAGIFLTDSRLGFLQEQCERRMKAMEVNSLPAYLDVLTVQPNREPELRQLLNELTVGETRFFRFPPQLDALRRVIIPAAVRSKGYRPSPQFRIWSAGCSSGEEAYTLAMVLLEEMQDSLQDWTCEVVASDLNDRALKKAREGIYREQVLQSVPSDFLQKYFCPYGNQLQVSDEVKAKVSFGRLNLLGDSKMVFMKGFDVIFCCNVLIYFDGAARGRTVEHFYNSLLPGGYLMVGKGESLFGVNTDFRLVHFPGAVAYHKTARVGER